MKALGDLVSMLTRSQGPTPRISRCSPTRAFVTPGAPLELDVETNGVEPDAAKLWVAVSELDRVVVRAMAAVEAPSTRIQVPLPADEGRGYGVQVTLHARDSERQIAKAQTAVDVRSTWWSAPRYGVLSEFSPGETYGRRTDTLLARHIDVVQFYDWMYRHYQYLPPDDPFTDVLGRTLSIASVRAALAAVHDRGMAGMAYGSVYGAEREYALAHPKELLYDTAGQPRSLGDIFYLQDVRPGPWRDRLLGEYRRAVQEVGFDGIHADQYGIEDLSFDARGELVPWGPAFSGVIEAAQSSVRGDGGDGIIFNFVNNWPIGEAGRALQLCTYIEVWPPHTTLRDLYDLVKGAKKITRSRQVILAAYMSCATGNPNAAQAATLLASSVIHASGGFHELLTEGDGILADPYYPNFVRPTGVFQTRLARHWDFIVEYCRYLSDPSVAHAAAGRLRGGIWTIHRSSPAFDTVSVINASPNDQWNEVRPMPPVRREVRIETRATGAVERVLLASPDSGTRAQRVPFERQGERVSFTIPRLDLWTLAILMHRETS